MAARFMEWGFVILPKTMERDEQTKKNIYKILEQAKVLEELMKEVEFLLSSTNPFMAKAQKLRINSAIFYQKFFLLPKFGSGKKFLCSIILKHKHYG